MAALTSADALAEAATVDASVAAPTVDASCAADAADAARAAELVAHAASADAASADAAPTADAADTAEAVDSSDAPDVKILSSAEAEAYAPALRALADACFPDSALAGEADDAVLSALAGPFHELAQCEWAVRGSPAKLEAMALLIPSRAV